MMQFAYDFPILDIKQNYVKRRIEQYYHWELF